MTAWKADCTDSYAEVIQGDCAILRADKPCTAADRLNVEVAAAAPDLLRVVARYTEVVDAADSMDFAAFVEELEEVRSDARRALAKAAGRDS